MAQANHVHTTTFDNLPTADLADLIGNVDAEIKALEARMKTAKGELTARGVDRAEGARFTITKSETVRWTLDTAAAKDALGETWCTKHSHITPVTSFRITVNRAALAVAA